MALAAAALLALGEGAGHAGAWVLKKGKGQAIANVLYTKSTHGFDAKGHPVPIPHYNKMEAGILVEYGITEWLTGMIQPGARVAWIGDPVAESTAGPGYQEIGARARLWSDKNSVVSVQALGRMPGAHDSHNAAEVGNTDPELDLRALGGRSFDIGTWKAFVDGQLAYRIRYEEPPSEYRVDLTFGFRPDPALLFMIQSFNTIADGSAKEPFFNQREHKVQLSAVWDFHPQWSVQFGGIGTVAGANALRERGIVAGLWRRW
jgi:hypothetical protein